MPDSLLPRSSKAVPEPPIIHARGGDRWTVAYWTWPRFNFYVRVGARTAILRRLLVGTSRTRGQEVEGGASTPGPCNHEWEYMEREPGETYTGYCERCVKCGDIIQVVQ